MSVVLTLRRDVVLPIKPAVVRRRRSFWNSSNDTSNGLISFVISGQFQLTRRVSVSTLIGVFSTVGGVTTLLLLVLVLDLSIDNVDVEDWRRLISTPGKSHGIWFVLC